MVQSIGIILSRELQMNHARNSEATQGRKNSESGEMGNCAKDRLYLAKTIPVSPAEIFAMPAALELVFAANVRVVTLAKSEQQSEHLDNSVADGIAREIGHRM